MPNPTFNTSSEFLVAFEVKLVIVNSRKVSDVRLHDSLNLVKKNMLGSNGTFTGLWLAIPYGQS